MAGEDQDHDHEMALRASPKAYEWATEAETLSKEPAHCDKNPFLSTISFDATEPHRYVVLGGEVTNLTILRMVFSYK